VGLEKLLSGINLKLSNLDFMSRAPADVVEREKEKKRIFELKISKLRGYIEGLKGGLT
jgi:valyl-tRNA synthetase